MTKANKLFKQIDQIIGCVPIEQGVVLPPRSRGEFGPKEKSATRLRIESMKPGESFAIRTHTDTEAKVVRKKLVSAASAARQEMEGKFSTRILPVDSGLEVRVWRTA